MIRCTARSVIPTIAATSLRTIEGLRDRRIKTWEWFVRKVQRALGDSDRVLGWFDGESVFLAVVLAPGEETFCFAVRVLERFRAT